MQPALAFIRYSIPEEEDDGARSSPLPSPPARAGAQIEGSSRPEQRGEDVICQAQRVDDGGGPCGNLVNDTLGLLGCRFADQELIETDRFAIRCCIDIDGTLDLKQLL